VLKLLENGAWSEGRPGTSLAIGVDGKLILLQQGVTFIVRWSTPHGQHSEIILSKMAISSARKCGQCGFNAFGMQGVRQ
jgi:hypothetical protein